MTDLIILRLHPIEPVDGGSFTAFLNGITIRAFDLSFGDSVTGVLIGQASDLANPHLPSTSNNTVNINNRSILQNYRDVPDPLSPPNQIRVLESVATAVLVVNAPAGHPEYPSPTSLDIRLEITRGGKNLVNQPTHYNVTVTSVGSLSTNQKTYFAMEPSAYVALPSSTVGLDPALAYVDLPSGGQPPKFGDLVSAINLVLAQDPGGAGSSLQDRPSLSAAQSHQIAAEIVWNRTLYPPPQPNRSLGELYTWPPADPAAPADQDAKDAIDRDRKQFEAEAAGYQATHDAEALRLAGFVYSASAAVACERLSKAAARAGLQFPILTGVSTGTEIASASLILTQAGPLNPSFVVSAAYFYALGAMLPMQVAPEQRYDIARLEREERVLGRIQAAVDESIIAVPAGPLTVAAPAINENQAARRLHALGSTLGAAPVVVLAAPVTTIVTDWLAYAGTTGDVDASFWTPEVAAQPAAYLELMLLVITQDHTALIAAIKAPPLSVGTVAALVAVTDQQWRFLFVGPPVQIALLPEFTQPGTPANRTEAFIRHLKTFFAVPGTAGTPLAFSMSSPPTLGMSVGDIFKRYTDAYLARAGAVFAFGVAANAWAKQQAIQDVFPGDREAQDWLTQALATIDALFLMTDLGAGFSELHFSLMEALFARGFTGPQDVSGLSSEEFQDALTGTVAYTHAATIYAKAGAVAPGPVPASAGFRPVNPDGKLTDCIPPPHLSPLGPVAYLAEMLRVSADSTCEVPFPQRAGAGLATLLASRRGPLGDLHATRANLETPIPMIDLVNESLEALTDGLPAIGGAVYDTAGEDLAGHKLGGSGHGASAGPGAPYRHDPQTLFAALPEHSSPATPVKKPGAYDKLKVDFSAPSLPYPQALDVNRSYLRALGSDRFTAMRTFREEITEFVLDPANEPAGFQKHLWRYPVGLPIALESLGISADEYSLLYAQDIVLGPNPGKLVLREVYGFATDVVDGRPWTDVVVVVPEFLSRTGLTYCEFLDLWRSKFVAFVRAGADPNFPECLPCCPADLVIDFPAPLDTLVSLRKLVVFVRLWRRLQQRKGPKLSFNELRDICDVIPLFVADAIQPGFLRQLAALLLLRDFLNLPLSDDGDPAATGATGADRTHLLALWVGPASPKWDWVIATLLERIDAYAEARERELQHPPELTKLLPDNLNPLSAIMGFDPGTSTDTWHACPTHTLRFAELLVKIYRSRFTVGEILFLFTNAEHLPGDDPFPLTDSNETLENPLDLPEDEDLHQLWALRGKLLAVAVDEAEAQEWTWVRIVHALRTELGWSVPPGTPDSLERIGEHCFPSVLEAAGHAVSVAARQYRVALATSSPLMWNTPPGQPFQYDAGTNELWTQLPLRDEAVVTSLQEMRSLTAGEQAAVHELYFLPRGDVSQLGFLFGSIGEAVERLIQEPDESKRWSYFRGEFARFYRRCRLIAEHLSEHVAAKTGRDERDKGAVAWKLLSHLHADENFGTSPWEDDTGVPPNVTWTPKPQGGAFAALLGVCGTGLLTEFEVQGNTVWREVSGPLSAFGAVRNAWNTPVPAILPAMNLTLTPQQQRFVVVRNGMALRDLNGEPLGGAQPFRVRWSGVLMIESPGDYRFLAGAPTPAGEPPDFDDVHEHRWRLTLKRGQKQWILLNHRWPGEDAPDSRSGEIALRRGAYEIVVEFEQVEPTFATAESICRRHTGFEIKYTGPDSGDCLAVIPADRLFRDRKTETLSAELGLAGAPATYLDRYYTSTLRDMRRTYQRAFKAILIAYRFGLSARTAHGDRQSELGYMIDHAAAFVGTSYPRTGTAAFNTHRAHLDFDFLPVRDAYRPPAPAQDLRSQPTAKRQAALFDWWERLWDYTLMRAETSGARERPAWLLFYEASERQPDDPPQLVRHIGVDIRHAPLVLNYFATPIHAVQTPELEDERWAVRAWQAEKWIRRLQRHFFPEWIGSARPDLWASDDPNATIGALAASGNENLTSFVRMGSFENVEPRRYEDTTRLNNELRVRARDALVAFLAGMNRVPLPWGGHATSPSDLSDLLLQDVQIGVCERASRIEEAITAVQTFIQRARLGLEPGFILTPALSLLWDKQFAEFWVWAICRRRRVYRENWIGWDEIEKARKTEAFRFLEGELRRAALTIPVPGGLEYWPGPRPPIHPGLTLLQHREPAGIQILTPGPDPEGLDLMGTPERHARQSWLAPLFRMRVTGPGDDDHGPDERDDNDPDPDTVNRLVRRPDTTHGADTAVRASAAPLAVPLERLPLWIQAAIRLGTRFVRVAAAGVPPASTGFAPHTRERAGTCCKDCGRVHPPVVDEYYFWLHDSQYYTSEGVIQDADQGTAAPGVAAEQTSDLHRPEKIPSLLIWESQPMVHLYWCRFHNGEFMQPRRSDDGVRIDAASLAPGTKPQLDFMGRTGDSLRFEVAGGVAPIGYGDPTIPGFDPTPPGFRFDMVTETASVLPLAAAPTAPPVNPYPGSLPVYPYFAYFAPGAPLLPASMFAEATTVAAHLRAHCRFEAALKWYALARDPLHDDSTWMQCPQDDDRVPDWPDQPTPMPADEDDTLLALRARARTERFNPDRPEVDERNDKGADMPCCPSTPVSDEVARNRAVTLDFLETLLQWGDALLCRNTPEAFQQARVILDTLGRVLGAKPLTILAEDDAKPMPLSAFLARPAPLNPRLLSLYDRSADRLTLIHHCLNGRRLRNGRSNLDMPYFGNMPLRDGWQTTGSICEDEADGCLSCCHAYRFVFLIQKALELAGEVRNFGAALLAAYEKGDAEYLMSLRSTHERQLLVLALEVRQLQWREADWQVQALEKTKAGAQSRLRYYQALLANGLNAGEIGYQSLTAVALATRISANTVEGVAQGMGTVPDMWIGVAGIMGSPLQFSQLPLGTKLAGTLATAARILNGVGENASTSAGLSLTEGGWDRREAEWRHQVEVIGIEIEQIERQILAAERRRDVSLCEINNHQRQIENAIEVQNFLRDKFTSHALYLYLQQETAALHRQSYELALHTARQAQQAFNYERGHTARKFLPTDGWDNLHEGLLSGEKLQVALHQMEKAYLNANCREYELTKHISLRSQFPHAFLQLRTTGYCEIEVPEWLFDLDYPGHYMRRIKNVSVTVPCVAGLYSGVHCRLTLLSSQTRVDPRLTPPPERCCDDPADADGYRSRADDARIVKTYAATEAIATSSGQNDSGLFELNFRDERYLPFEFSGAISRWRIELPPENNQWALESLADFVLHVNYTSREGGDVLRRAANNEAQRHLPGAGVRLFDVRHEFPDAWQMLRNPGSAHHTSGRLPLALSRAMFPFLPGRREISVHRVELFFEALGATPSANRVVEFLVGDTRGSHDGMCVCDRHSITCIASSEWPGLYHGVLDLLPQRIPGDSPHVFGSLTFPQLADHVERLFVMCWYQVG